MLAIHCSKYRRCYLRKKASKILSTLEEYLTCTGENSKVDNENHIIKRPRDDDILVETTSPSKKQKEANNNILISTETLMYGSGLLNVIRKVNTNYIEKLVLSFFKYIC